MLTDAKVKIDRGAFQVVLPEKLHGVHGQSVPEDLNRLTTALNDLIERLNQSFKRMDTAWKTLKVFVEGSTGTNGLGGVFLTTCPFLNGTNTLDFPYINTNTGQTGVCQISLTNCAGS